MACSTDTTSAIAPWRANGPDWMKTDPATAGQRLVPGLSPALRRRMQGLFRMLTALSPQLAARLAMRLFLTPFSRRLNSEELLFLAGAHAHRLPTRLGPVYAYEWPGGGATVLVVHGWISNAARMAEVIRALRERGLRVVAFDAPAHGRSPGRQVDLHGFRAAIAAVEARFGPIHGVVAHSFGALTTATWLAEAPPTTLRAAVLVGLPRDIGYLFESYTLAMALRADVVVRLRQLFRVRYGNTPEHFSARELAAQLRMPVLMVHGGADELIPAAQAVEVSEQLRNGELRVIEGLRHSAPLRDPVTVAAIADFLAVQLGR